MKKEGFHLGYYKNYMDTWFSDRRKMYYDVFCSIDYSSFCSIASYNFCEDCVENNKCKCCAQVVKETMEYFR